MTERTHELAYFSDLVYRPDALRGPIDYDGQRFKMIARSTDANTGFAAAAFQSQKDRHTVIAFRGTDDVADGVVDFAMVTTRLNIQAPESELFTASVVRGLMADSTPGTPLDVTVTGHSLGGGLAQLNAERFNLPGETFNAYGTAGLLAHKVEGGKQVVNHVRAGDPVSAASGHFGEVRVYATSDDIRSIEMAGYGYDRDSHPGRIFAVMSVDAHRMANFVDGEKGQSILSAESQSLYESHRKSIDQYRHDVRSSRELTTYAAGHSAEFGFAAATLAVPEVKNAVLATAYAKASDLVRTAEAIEHGASWVGNMVAVHMAPEGTAKAIYGSATGSPEIDRRLRALSITDEGHPGNTMYKQALHGVEKLDGQQGRQPDGISRNLAASLAVEGRRAGLERIDHVLLNDDASRAYAVQGALDSPHKAVASLQTELGISTSIDTSSREWNTANATAVQTQQEIQAQTHSQQAAFRPQGP